MINKAVRMTHNGITQELSYKGLKQFINDYCDSFTSEEIAEINTTLDTIKALGGNEYKGKIIMLNFSQMF